MVPAASLEMDAMLGPLLHAVDVEYEQAFKHDNCQFRVRHLRIAHAVHAWQEGIRYHEHHLDLMDPNKPYKPKHSRDSTFCLHALRMTCKMCCRSK